jgi:hypothetical protein
MMVMIPLILDDQKLADLKAFAQANPIPLSELRQIAEAGAPCVGDREGYSVVFDIGWRLVFSIEEHPCRWMRHMSVSQAATGRYPNKHTMELLGEALGFPPLDECIIDKDGTAISVMAQAFDVKMSDD